MDQELHDRERNGNTLRQTQQGTSENSTNSVNQVIPETVIVVRPVEDACVSGEYDNSEAKVNYNVLGSIKVSAEESKIKAEEVEKQSCVIDVKCGNGGFDGNWDEEKVCRICHLTSDHSAESSTDLVVLGCGCKDELGAAHSQCAEAWFKLKGNRLCEICGETAKNVTGVGDNRFMEEWNENRLAGSNANSSDSSGGCWRRQPFCNFLMSCLVIAFVLPWFFRANMF